MIFFINFYCNYCNLLLVLPESEKGEELCPLTPPFSLLLREEEEELGFEVDALLENCRDLHSEHAK